jgi:hypothetical protein
MSAPSLKWVVLVGFCWLLPPLSGGSSKSHGTRPSGSVGLPSPDTGATSGRGIVQPLWIGSTDTIEDAIAAPAAMLQPGDAEPLPAKAAPYSSPRALTDVLRVGGALLGDNLLFNWTRILCCFKSGALDCSVDQVGPQEADFRSRIRLGHDYHILCWRKRAPIHSVDRSTHHLLPGYVTFMKLAYSSGSLDLGPRLLSSSRPCSTQRKRPRKALPVCILRAGATSSRCDRSRRRKSTTMKSGRTFSRSTSSARTSRKR